MNVAPVLPVRLCPLAARHVVRSETNDWANQLVVPGDPWLEPGLAEELKAELTACNIRLLYFYSYQFGDARKRIGVLGLDDVFRELAEP
jgi:hypothetical protein